MAVSHNRTVMLSETATVTTSSLRHCSTQEGFACRDQRVMDPREKYYDELCNCTVRSFSIHVSFQMLQQITLPITISLPQHQDGVLFGLQRRHAGVRHSLSESKIQMPLEALQLRSLWRSKAPHRHLRHLDDFGVSCRLVLAEMSNTKSNRDDTIFSQDLNGIHGLQKAWDFTQNVGQFNNTFQYYVITTSFYNILIHFITGSNPWSNTIQNADH